MAGFTFISGATGGIGFAFCELSAKCGDNLFLTGRSEDKLRQLRDRLLALNNLIEIDYFPCDLESEESRQKMIDYIDLKAYKFGKVIHVAGIDIQKAFEKYTLDKLIRQVRVNAEANIALTFEFLKRREKSLEIVVISSISGIYPMPYFALYSATKSMIINFYSSLRVEQKKLGVKITVVCPAGVYTRPDILKDIKGQGFWGRITAKSPKFIAETSLKAVKKNKRLLIPGTMNKIMIFITKFIPIKLKMNFIARRWKKLEKDAF